MASIGSDFSANVGLRRCRSHRLDEQPGADPRRPGRWQERQIVSTLTDVADMVEDMAVVTENSNYCILNEKCGIEAALFWSARRTPWIALANI
jgi:hypothetical protein